MPTEHNRWKRQLGLRAGIACVLLGAASWCWLEMAERFEAGLANAPDATLFGLAGFAMALVAAVLMAPPLAGFVVWLLWPSRRTIDGMIPLRYLAAEEAAQAGRHDEAYAAFGIAAENGDPEVWPYIRMLELATGPLDDPSRFEIALRAGRTRLTDALLTELELAADDLRRGSAGDRSG